jgi:hypothetical protein
VVLVQYWVPSPGWLNQGLIGPASTVNGAVTS